MRRALSAAITSSPIRANLERACRLLVAGALFASFLITPAIGEAHAPGVVLSGFGTATVDGVVGPEEWNNAGCLMFPVNVPEGGTTSGEVCVMNDEATLYLLIRFARTFIDAGNTADFTFDNNHNDVIFDNGDDAVLINPGGPGFVDAFRSNQPPCPPDARPGACGFRDIDFGGTNDGTGAFSNNGSFTVYEFSHPLDTADNLHDFSLAPGQTVGFILSVRLIDNDVIADTSLPERPLIEGMGDIVIAFPSRRVDIDVKPGSFQNTVNPKSNGVIPVAILTTAAFDASTVDWTTVRFGVTGNEASAVSAAREDVDGDGDLDLILHFRTQDTAIQCGETAVTLTGKTSDGQAIEGSDSVTTVGCKK